jgi:hypothetical protein
MTQRELGERFLEKVRKTDACWEWTACKDRHGYGLIGVGGHRVVYAHRVAYELFVGAIPRGKQVLHQCDNPLCVRPTHLFIGTNADNRADSVAKGRQARGEQNGRAKLTRLQIQEIRRQYQPNSHEFGGRALGRRHGVSQPTIWNILHGRLWKEVSPK